MYHLSGGLLGNVGGLEKLPGEAEANFAETASGWKESGPLRTTNIGTAVVEADYGSAFSRTYVHEAATGFLVPVLFQRGVRCGC